MAKKSKKSTTKPSNQSLASRRSRQIQRVQQAQQRASTLPISRLTDEDVANYRSEMQKVIIYANDRIDELQRQGLTTVELYRFQDGDSSRYFSLPETDDLNELRAYMTEVRVVLASIAEDSSKSLLDTAMIESAQYRGQFGNQFPVHRFNINDVVNEEGEIIRHGINPEIASQAFRAYRNLEKEYGPIIGRQGQEGVYGSENLIIAVYDYYERGMDGQLYGRDLLEAWQTKFLREMEGVNWSLDEATSIVAQWDDFISTRWF